MIRHLPASIVLNALLRSVLPDLFAGRGHHNTPPAVGVRRPASLPWHLPYHDHPRQEWATPRRVKQQGKAGKLLRDTGA